MKGLVTRLEFAMVWLKKIRDEEHRALFPIVMVIHQTLLCQTPQKMRSYEEYS